MLFMVVEHFRAGHPRAVGDRFERKGRLIPSGSPVAYVTSWMAADGTVCYQLMESPTRRDLDPWLAQWQDLVHFEVHAVESSAEYWERAHS